MANTPAMLQTAAAARALHDPSLASSKLLKTAYDKVQTNLIHDFIEALGNIDGQYNEIKNPLEAMEPDIQKTMVEAEDGRVTTTPGRRLDPAQEGAKPSLSNE